MEFTKEIEKMFDAEQAISTVEKTALSVLSYVQPTEVRKVLVDLTQAQVDFTRANMAAFKSIGAMVKTSTQEFTKSFEKVGK
jgi:hypothetical protein